MIIDCISDLHGHYPKLEGGDLLIVAGDYTRQDSFNDLEDFRDWMADQSYKCRVFIGGNHDNYLEEFFPSESHFRTGTYLCDSGTEFEGLKIWGSPWTRTFEGMNPHCMAFTCDTEEQLAEKFALIPDDVDILITHSPPEDILDELEEEEKHVGSIALFNRIKKIRPKLHVFGHIHSSYGIKKLNSTTFINASYVNERYEPVNKPQRIEL